jgi:hypothetical protein
MSGCAATEQLVGKLTVPSCPADLALSGRAAPPCALAAASRDTSNFGSGCKRAEKSQDRKEQRAIVAVHENSPRKRDLVPTFGVQEKQALTRNGRAIRACREYQNKAARDRATCLLEIDTATGLFVLQSSRPTPEEVRIIGN